MIASSSGCVSTIADYTNILRHRVGITAQYHPSSSGSDIGYNGVVAPLHKHVRAAYIMRFWKLTIIIDPEDFVDSGTS